MRCMQAAAATLAASAASKLARKSSDERSKPKESRSGRGVPVSLHIRSSVETEVEIRWASCRIVLCAAAMIDEGVDVSHSLCGLPPRIAVAWTGMGHMVNGL